MKYRKKPVVIDAEVYKLGLEDGFEEYCTWVNVFMKDIKAEFKCKDCISYSECKGGNLVLQPYINTLEGKHYIRPGDFIITGVKGERYPCKPDIFEMTYEKVEDAE